MKGNGRKDVSNPSGAQNGGNGHLLGSSKRASRRSINGSNGSAYALITGGSGFIGANLAHRLLADGERVVLYDNISRDGVEQNFEWLHAEYGNRVRLVEGDTRDAESVADAIEHASAVFHFAAQVAVTTSLESPRDDYAINAGGTLNVLEALRARRDPPPLFFTSTNKVYGPLADVQLRLREQRYEPLDQITRGRGIDEGQRLDFYSPYGCSKGAADKYILDYSRSYGLPAVVFRMSCIYGPRQFGTEDQGWVAHFLIRSLADEAITMFGDGCQVRDILYVEDLVEAFLLARREVGDLSGNAFNIGGGPGNTVSLLELIELIGELDGRRPRIEWRDWRLGDQRFYVSDTNKFCDATGWRADVPVADGVRRLHSWLIKTRLKTALAPLR